MPRKPKPAKVVETSTTNSQIVDSRPQRDEHGRLLPGVVLNPTGRPPGPNKATVEVREAAHRLINDPIYRANLLTRMQEGKAGPMEVYLWQVVGGRPAAMDDSDTAKPNEQLQWVRFLQALPSDEMRAATLKALAAAMDPTTVDITPQGEGGQ